MDLGQFNDDRALNALIQIASNPQEDWIILDACGESIGEILVKREEFQKEILDKLVPDVKDIAVGYIRRRKPEWLK
jgi:HEAT repeat protein